MQGLLDGAELEWCYESVRLYLLCEGMNWAHLPVAGGIYAQHPRLLDEWSIIFDEKAKWQRRQKDSEQDPRRAALYESAGNPRIM